MRFCLLWLFFLVSLPTWLEIVIEVVADRCRLGRVFWVLGFGDAYQGADVRYVRRYSNDERYRAYVCTLVYNQGI